MYLVLASASPRRRELLEAAGYTFDVAPADVDERPRPGEIPHAYVARVALAKAEAVAPAFPGAIVLGADTAVVVDREVLGKPVDDRDAARMLAALAGRAHDVITGIALVGGSRTVVAVESTTVWMRDLSDDVIRDYIASGEPRDKAGAYGIQGLASRFIPRIEGSYTNVVGLPVAAVSRLLSGPDFRAAVRGSG
jgi:septum formation protein